jgi:DeoR family fructose operon transcriptional repressor
VSNVQGTLASEERLAWLEERLRSDGAVTIPVAADALAVSEMTIRRDLAELESRGTARRVRGGARAVGPQPFAQRHHTAARAKVRIAAKLAGLVPDRGAVAFDASSTVMRLSTALSARDLTVMTNGPDTFAALQGAPGVTALLTGGRLEERTGSLVGPLASRCAALFSAEVFFASASAIHPASGALEASLDEAEVKRAIAATAREVVLAVDSSKLERRAVALGLEWEQVDLLVTDLDPANARLDPYRRLTRIL